MADVLDRAVVILKNTESFIVPVKWLWNRISTDSVPTDLSMDRFLESIKNDDRFRIFDSERFSISSEFQSSLPQDKS